MKRNGTIPSILTVCLLLFGALESTWAQGSGSNNYKLSCTDFTCCASDVEGLKCWGHAKAIIADIPKFRNLRDFDLQRYTDSAACGIDDDGVKCWGNRFLPPIPKFRQPKFVRFAQNHDHIRMCVMLEDGELHCVRSLETSWTLMKKFKNPRLLTSNLCVVDDNGLSCYLYWLNSNGIRANQWETPMPKLTTATSVSGGSQDTCGTGVEGLVCWDWLGRPGTPIKGIYPEMPKTTLAVSVSLGSNVGCAIEASGIVNCWLNGRDVPANWKRQITDAVNPSQVSCGNDHCCLMDEEKISCWGDNKHSQSSPPPFLFDNTRTLEGLIRKAQRTMTPVRSEYFAIISKAIAKNPIAWASSPEATLLVLSLTWPALAGLDSPYNVEVIVPNFQKQLNEARVKHGSLNVKLTNENRLVALESLRAALTQATLFLAPEKRGSVQDAIRAIGQAETDLSSQPLTEKALLEIRRLDLSKIAASTKSAFLLDILSTASKWLETASR